MAKGKKPGHDDQKIQMGRTDVIRCDQCGQLPGECVNDYGKPIGNCYTHKWTQEDGLAPD